MIGNLAMATLWPRICLALGLVILLQFGAIAWLSHTKETLVATNGATAANLNTAKAAITALRAAELRARKAAVAARKEADAAKGKAQGRINAVRHVKPSGDACADARRKIDAYLSAE